MPEPPNRETGVLWTAGDVIGLPPNGEIADLMIRLYLEQSDLRRYVALAASRLQLETACDIGAGFGRLSPVLAEFCARVVAFERERELVQTGRRLLPNIDFHQVEALDKLNVDDRSFDLVMSFTVLQHLSDEAAARTLVEVKRLLRRPGMALLCEESDAEHRWGDWERQVGRFTIGRSVQEYERLMAPLQLLETGPRRLEASYPRNEAGTYMLFGWQ